MDDLEPQADLRLAVKNHANGIERKAKSQRLNKRKKRLENPKILEKRIEKEKGKKGLCRPFYG